MPTPPPTPVERFATILLSLALAVAARGIEGRLGAPLVALILGRLRDIKRRVARIAARIQRGHHVPRQATRRPSPALHRRPNPLPQNFGWLLKLVPEAVGYRSQLEHLLREEDMAALLAAASASLSRPLRSLCRMLLVEPPAILPASRPAPPLATGAAPLQAPPPLASSPPAAPPACRATSAPPPCACGPPLPA